MKAIRHRPRWAMGSCLAIALAVTTLTTGGPDQPTVQAPTLILAHRSVVLPPAPSPARCRISHIGWPHFARSVPGAVKVNAIATCDAPVEQQTLSVTLIDVDAPTTPLKRTVTKVDNEAQLENKNTWVMCKNKDMHTFRGMAFGASWEKGRPYTYIVMGATRPLPCGY